MGFDRSDLLRLQQTHTNLNGTFHCGTRLQNYIQDIAWKGLLKTKIPLLKFIFLYAQFEKHSHVYSVRYFHLVKTFDSFLNIVSQLRRLVAAFPPESSDSIPGHPM
jgi:hypothetical protein